MIGTAIALIISCISLLALIALISFLAPYFFGAPFEPMPKEDIKKILKILEKMKSRKRNIKIVDLGSGNGDIIFELSKKNYRAVGYEINPILFLYSKIKRRILKAYNTEIYFSNFWKKNLSNFDVVVVFQIGYIMEKLEKKLKKELKKRALIISYHWKFPNWKHIKRNGDFYLYKR